MAPVKNYERQVQRRQLSRVVALGPGALLFGTVAVRPSGQDRPQFNPAGDHPLT